MNLIQGTTLLIIAVILAFTNSLLFNLFIGTIFTAIGLLSLYNPKWAYHYRIFFFASRYGVSDKLKNLRYDEVGFMYIRILAAFHLFVGLLVFYLTLK